MLRTGFNIVQRRGFFNTGRVMIAEGDRIPSVQVQLSSPAETVDTAELFKNKKAILFGKLCEDREI